MCGKYPNKIFQSVLYCIANRTVQDCTLKMASNLMFWDSFIEVSVALNKSASDIMTDLQKACPDSAPSSATDWDKTVFL